MRRDSFEHVNLLELIDPKGESIKSEFNHNWNSPKEVTKIGDQIYSGQRYDLVLSWFSRQPDDGDWKKIRRNSVQDKILAVSTSRCNVFKTYLRRQQVDVNFTLGTLTTVAGVLGAVVPGIEASRNLAGLAGIFSGVRGEFNQSYYSNLAAHVIVQGIESRQNRLKKELIEGRMGRSVTDYTMEAAINDAIVIDGNCSTVSGLIEAQDAIREVENPGLPFAQRALNSIAAMRELIEKPRSQLISDGTYDKLNAIASAAIPSMLVTSTRADTTAGASNELIYARDAQTRIVQQITFRAGQVGAEFEALQKKAPSDAQSPLSADDVKKAFTTLLTTGVYDKLTTQDPKVLATCIDGLAAPTGTLGSETAKALLVANDPLKRAVAQNAIEKARAEAKLAAIKVEKIVATAIAAIDTTAEAAKKGLNTQASVKDVGMKGLTTAELSNIVKPDFQAAAVTCS